MIQFYDLWKIIRVVKFLKLFKVAQGWLGWHKLWGDNRSCVNAVNVCRSSVKYTYNPAWGNFLISIRQHEAGKHCHNHFMSSSDNVLWQGVHRGPNPPGWGDGVLGIAQEPILLLTHQAPVHCSWLEGVYELQDGDTAPEALVLEQWNYSNYY